MGPLRDSSINLLGGFDIAVEGNVIPRLRSRKGRVLLALLIVRAARPVERPWLAAVLWPDSTDSQALAGLRQTLADLRRALGPAAPIIEAPSARTLLFRPGTIPVDVLEFDAAIEKGDDDALERAVHLYKGPLLDGSSDEAIWNERERRELAFVNALESVASARSKRDDHAGAAECYRRLIAEDPYRETAVQAYMRLCAKLGNYPEAYVAYRDLRNRLSQDLRAQPTPETVATYEQIRRQARQRVASGQVSQSGSLDIEAQPLPEPSRTRPSAVETLPFPLTSLVGRAGEIASVKGRLEAARLVTLTGIGAIGKTRIALAVGHDLAQRYRDGVRFVDLGSVPDHSVETVLFQSANSLEGSQFLLIVDTADRVSDSCAPALASLLQSYPRMRILTTSRRAFGVPGEVVVRIGPLGTPDTSWSDPSNSTRIPDSLQGLVHVDSIRLFLERAAAVSPGFALNVETGPWIARICLAVDGHPLAIEMAAARTRLLSLSQIAAWMESNLLALTAGPGVPVRHRTLCDVVDGSCRDLPRRERLLLGRLSVFAGGWTHEAAEIVCVDRDISREEMLNLLAGLVDRSLVWVDWLPSGAVRYRLPPIVRRYCLEKSETRLDGDSETRRRFVSHYLGLCAGSGLRGSRRQNAVEQIDAELANIEAALDSSPEKAPVDRDYVDAVLCLVALWAIRGRPLRAIPRLDKMIGSRGEELDPSLRAEAALALGDALQAAGQSEAAETSLLDAQTRFQGLHDASGEARTLSSLAAIALARGEIARARELGEQSIDHFRSRRLLVTIDALEGKADAAVTRAAEILQSVRIDGDELLVGDAMLTMGQVSEFTGDIDTARRAYTATLALAEVWRAGPLAVSALEGMARVHLARDRQRRAVLLLSAAGSYRERNGLGADILDTAPISLSARQIMAAPAFLAERQAGARMMLSQAIASAQE